jgi:hypothetical protein
MLPVHIVRLQFGLNCLPDDVIHVSGSCCEEAGVVKLNFASQVDTMLHHS